MRKYILLGPIVLVVIALTWVLASWLLAPPRLSLEFCDRIKSGMTRQEVQDILGPPAGSIKGANWGDTYWYAPGVKLTALEKINPVESWEWHGEGINFSVLFDEDGIVVGQKREVVVHQQRFSFFEVIRVWLRF